MKIVTMAIILTCVGAAVHAADVYAASGAPVHWWSSEAAAHWTEPVLGLIGALIGVLAGLTVWLASRGRARRLIVVSWYILFAIGIAVLCAGTIARTDGQPSTVYGPLQHTGFLSAFFSIFIVMIARKRYEDWEHRKMNDRGTVMSR